MATGITDNSFIGFDHDRVKATSIIFLVGVGSFVCYRLYHRYKRRGTRPPSSDKGSPSGRDERPRLVHWVSRELLESCLNSDDELQDIKREYFGPAEQSDDSSLPSSCVDLDGLAILPTINWTGGYSDIQNPGVVSRHRMGHSFSSNGTTKSRTVGYNIRSGVNLLNPRDLGKGGEGRQQFIELHPTPHRKRPDSLPLHCRHNVGHFRTEADGGLDDAKSAAAAVACKAKKGNDGDSDSVDSFCDLDSPQFRISEEEDGDDEGGDDDESLFTHSGLHSQGDIENYSQTCSGSLMANYSPGSLLNRRLLASPSHEQPPPDGLEARLTSESGKGESTDAVGGEAPPKRLGRKSSSDDMDSLEHEKSDKLEDELFAFPGSKDLSVSSGGGPKHMPRDSSFGSECSEISVDTSVFNDIGATTQNKIQHLQQEIDLVKQDCQDLESYMENVNVHGPMPAIYTELVNSPLLSDVSECSDVPAPFRRDSTESLQLAKRRAAFKRVHPKSSVDTSLERHSSAASSRAANNTSANLSLEWDSMKGGGTSSGCEGGEASSFRALPNNNNSVALFDVPHSPPGARTAVRRDSGSDFGTPLTNGSPEPCRRKRSGSVASLEWDEEFGNCPSYSEQLEPVTEQQLARRLFVPDTSSKRKDSHRTAPLPVKCRSVHHLSPGQNGGQLMPTNSDSLQRTLTIKTDEKVHMWSSMESGYIDEFSESSRQVSPQDATTMGTNSNVSKGMDTTPTTVPVREDVKEVALRTWPVVGCRKTMREFGQTLQCMRKEFFTASQHLRFKHLRPIQDDHYCALRAVLMQALSQGFSVLEHSGGVGDVKKKLGTWMRSHSPWIKKWNFARHIPYTHDDSLQTMLACLETLDWLISCVLSSLNRENVAADMLNFDPEVDVQAMESLKLLMLCSAIELHQAMSVDSPIPSFVRSLFARATSPTPEAFLVNHLNGIGHTSGLGPLELFLLGYTLGVTICIMSPYRGGNGEFVSYYPDYDLGSRPELYIVSDDGCRFSIMVE